jgi:mono/diheme cytochrome c family protein
MSRLPRWIAPVAAGLLAAVAAFAIVTVAVDDGGPARDAAVSPTALDGSSGETIFARMGCGSCHRLAAAGSTGEIGPDLDERLSAHDRASLIAVITDSDRGGDFVAMPEDFGRRMNSAELNALVDFLLAAGGSR